MFAPKQLGDGPEALPGGGFALCVSVTQNYSGPSPNAASWLHPEAPPLGADLTFGSRHFCVEGGSVASGLEWLRQR